MLKYLTSMSLAELLTTLAAWGGLVLGLVNFWKQNFTRLIVQIQVEVRNTTNGTILCNEEVVKNAAPELCSWIQDDSSLVFKITNLSQFTVYIESFGFSKSWFKDRKIKENVVKFPDISIILGRPEGIDPNTQGVLQTPFALRSLETVSLRLDAPYLSRETIEQIKATKCTYVFAKTTNNYVTRHNCKELFDAFLNRIDLP